MMRPLFLERGWKLRRAARTALIVAAYGVVFVVGFYCIRILSGIVRIMTEVCP
jgi:hypothetical protein